MLGNALSGAIMVGPRHHPSICGHLLRIALTVPLLVAITILPVRLTPAFERTPGPACVRYHFASHSTTSPSPASLSENTDGPRTARLKALRTETEEEASDAAEHPSWAFAPPAHSAAKHESRSTPFASGSSGSSVALLSERQRRRCQSPDRAEFAPMPLRRPRADGTLPSTADQSLTGCALAAAFMTAASKPHLSRRATCI